jgi:hypothetical protein
MQLQQEDIGINFSARELEKSGIQLLQWGVRELIIQPGSKCIRETVPAGGTHEPI